MMPHPLVPMVLLYLLMVFPALGYLSLGSRYFEYFECWRAGAELHFFALVPLALVGGCVICIFVFAREVATNA